MQEPLTTRESIPGPIHRSPARSGDDQTRMQLVMSGLRLFAAEGVRGVSLRRVMLDAGAANQSAVHYYFGNRTGLTQAVLDYVNSKLKPLQDEALAELVEVDCEVGATVDHVVRIGLAPYIYLFNGSEEGKLCIQFLSRLTWETGAEAQALMVSKVRPYFLKLMPYLVKALPHKHAEALDFQFYMAAANVIHGLADIRLLSTEPGSPVDRLYRERSEDLLNYFFSYITAGLSGQV